MALEQAGVQLVAQDASAFNSALASATGSLDKFSAGLDKAGQTSTQSSQVMTGALRRVGEIAVNALAAAGGALASFIASSVSGAADYEQSMNVLQSTTGATDAQMQKVKDTAKALGADLTLPATSAASAGQAMTYLAQQGLSVDDAMAAAKGTLQLAAAGMVDEKEAAITTASALNQFHLAGSEATRVADLLAASVSASGSNVSQTGQAVQQAGASFAAAKIPLEDFVTMVNEMSKAGIKGSDAGTSLKTMLMRLQAPTDAAASAMEKLGISVYDSQGAMRPMRDIIGQFSSSLKGLTQQERDQAIVTIFGADAQRSANIILAGGTEAYDKMRTAVMRSGAAGQLAGAQMKGLNGAVAGLQSQLETLALEALEPILPILSGLVTKAAEFAGSFVGKVGPAVVAVMGGVQELAGILSGVFLPALAGATAALIAYGITAVVPMLVNIPAMTAVLIYNTAAFVANAVAVAAAAAPYALIAAAIAGVVFAWNDFNAKVQTATDKMLAANPTWAESTRLMEEFGQASDETRAKLQPQIDAIQMQRDMLRGQIEDLGKRMAAGAVTQELYDAEMVKINGLNLAINAESQAIKGQIDAQVAAQAATMTATAQTQAQTIALGENQQATQLTADDLKKLADQLDKTFRDGTQAVSDYVTTAASLMAQLGDTSKKVDDRITADQAAAYAQQAAAQRAHLGDMLAQYTMAQVQLGNITQEQAGVILSAIERQFGSTDQTASKTFLSMEQTIDKFAKSGGASADALSKSLGSLQDDAIATKEKMDALAKKYTAELVQNFQEGKIDADEFRHALEQIPSRVNVEVHTDYTSSGHPPEVGGSTVVHMAGGGPVSGGRPYLVGEQGPELFTPATNGQITPAASSMQIMTQNSTSYSYTTSGNTYNYSPTYGGTPRAPMASFLTMKAFNL